MIIDYYMTMKMVNIVRCEDIRLGEDWFLLVFVLLEALSDAVAHHVMVWVLQLDCRGAELDVDSSWLLSVGLSPSSFGWVPSSRRVPVPIPSPFPGC